MSRRGNQEKEKDAVNAQPIYQADFGFANLPNQIHRNAVKRGFEFTVMVVGESGLGKSTLINSLFLTDLYKGRDVQSGEKSISRTTEIQKYTVDIEERGVKLRLNVVDTPGFGDAISNIGCHRPIVKYIDEQFERYLSDESGLNRRQLRDTRVHCLFYFVAPHQRGLKPLDLHVLRAVHTRVNVLVLIAKADTLTTKEQEVLKNALRKQLDANGIRLYQIPECADDEDEDFKAQCAAIQAAMPFAVVGASCVRAGAPGSHAMRTRGRMYEFGFVEVDNPNHCDFAKLRGLLVTHMQDLLDVTHEVIYENYRVAKLSKLTSADCSINSSIIAQDDSGKMTDCKKDANRCSEDTTSRPSVASTAEAEKQLVEKESELRRMRDLLAKIPQDCTSTSDLSLSAANTSVSVHAVSNPVSIDSPNCTPRSGNMACSTPNNSSKQGMPSVCTANKELPQPVVNTPKGDTFVSAKTNCGTVSAQASPASTLATARGTNAYSSLTHNRTQLLAETTGGLSPPANVKKTLDMESVDSPMSRSSSLMPLKKAPPVLPRSANATLRPADKATASSSFML